MIDPLEAVIQWLRKDLALNALVADRIAAKHRYGDPTLATVPDWSTANAGLMVRLDGGAVDLYAPLQAVRLELRCYAPSQWQGMQIWARLVELSRSGERFVVDTSAGAALVHQWQQASGPSALFDAEMSLDFILAFFNAVVGEEEASGGA